MTCNKLSTNFEILVASKFILKHNSDFIASVSKILNVCFHVTQLLKLRVKNIKEQTQVPSPPSLPPPPVKRTHPWFPKSFLIIFTLIASNCIIID